MTDLLSRISLGSVPDNKQAYDLCIRLKQEVFRRFGRVDGAYLLTVTEDHRRGVEVVYTADEPGAEAWASRVAQAAEEVWKKMQQAGKEKVRR